MSSSPYPRPQQGYALVIMLVMLVTGSLYAIASRLDANRLKAAQVTETARALQLARDALLAYASTYREQKPENDGSLTEGFAYLPCPDLENDDGPPLNMVGTGAGNCAGPGSISIGLLPHKSLGLPELRDSEGNCLWYAVSGMHKGSSAKTNELNWDTRGQLEVLDVGGSKVIAVDGEEGGAVAIVIAPGPPLAIAAGHQSDARAPVAGKSCSTDSSQMAAYLEALGPPFTNGIRKAADGSITSNDQLAWLTARDIFTQVKKRSDFASYINTHIAALRTKLAAALPAAGGGNTLPVGNPFDKLDANEKSSHTFYSAWYDQFQYYTCSASPYCFRSANGTKCDGVLLMSGSGIRSSTEWSANVQAQEARGFVFTAAESATAPGEPRAALRRTPLDRYEDALPFVANTANPFIATPLYARDTPTRDLATCLRFLVQGFDNFQPIQTPASLPGQSVVNTATDPSLLQPGLQRLILGSTSTVAAYGCAWHPDALATGNGIHIYFRFRITDLGDGFTLTLADANSNPTVQMCGETGSALGYSGNNQVTAPIHSPKLALEFDTRASISGNPPNAQGDPYFRHAAFVYWAGNSRDDNLDNTHGSCASNVTPNTPCNPSTYLNIGTTISNEKYVAVRLDVMPISGQAGHTLTAYVVPTSYLGPECALENLDAPIGSFKCKAPSSTSYEQPLQASLPFSMPLAYLGFTVGQRATTIGDQTITIDNFKAKGN